MFKNQKCDAECRFTWLDRQTDRGRWNGQTDRQTDRQRQVPLHLAGQRCCKCPDALLPKSIVAEVEGPQLRASRERLRVRIAARDRQKHRRPTTMRSSGQLRSTACQGEQAPRSNPLMTT
jgi:hypothetical protein